MRECVDFAIVHAADSAPQSDGKPAFPALHVANSHAVQEHAVPGSEAEFLRFLSCFSGLHWCGFLGREPNLAAGHLPSKCRP